MKKILSIICIIALALSMTGTVWAEEDFSLPETPEEDYGIAPASVNDPSTWIPYEVTGGNIYFDPETQNIVGCDSSVTEAVIPAEIDGKAVRMIVSMNNLNDGWGGMNSRLQKVIILDGVFGIGDKAFYNCRNLNEIQIPVSVVSIENGAFQYCESLVTVNLPPKLTTISQQLFYYCSSITEINIPSGVKTIGIRAFESCTSLEKVNIPDGVTNIGSYAFRDCSSLKTLYIPDSVSSIGSDALAGCESLESISVGENNPIYHSEDGVLFRGTSLILYPMAKPDEEYTVPAVAIANQVGDPFLGNPYLKILKFTTGKYGFGISNLSSLKEVHLPLDMGIISSGVFSGCYAITDVYYDGCAERWEKIKNSAVGDNGSLFAATVHFNENDHIIQGIELELGETQTVVKYEPVSLAAFGSYSASLSQAKLYYLEKPLYYYTIDTDRSAAAYIDGNDVKVSVKCPGATEFRAVCYGNGFNKSFSFNTSEFTLEDIVPTSGYVSVSITANAGNVCGFTVYPDQISGSNINIGDAIVEFRDYRNFAPAQTVFPFGSENLPFGGEPSDYEIEIGFSYTVAGSQTQDYYLIGRERLSQSTPHEHIFGDEWKNDAQNHWHVCKKCSQTSAPEPHTLVNGVCTACGYVQPEHVHHFACVGAEGVHWDQCDECGYTTNVRAHSIVDGRCSECGYSPAKTYDANGDGEVTLDDAIIVLKAAMKVLE